MTTALTDTHRRAGNGVASLPPPPRRPLSARVPASLAVAVVAGILAVISVLFVTGGADVVPVAVAARDIAAGERVDADAFRFIGISAPDEVVGRLLRRQDMSQVAGRVATHTVSAGSLVERAALAPAAAPRQLRAMSFAVDAEHAVGGAVRPGDRIDVIDAGGPVYVVTDAEVLAAPAPAHGRFSVTRKRIITVAVDAQQALRLAAAIERGKVEVVRATGAPPIAPARPSGAPTSPSSPG